MSSAVSHHSITFGKRLKLQLPNPVVGYCPVHENDWLLGGEGDDLMYGGSDTDRCTDPMGTNKMVDCEVKE